MSTAAATTNAGDAPTQNIGFAIPIVSIQKLLEGLRSGGTAGPLKAFLGVAVETVSAASGLGVSAGAVVVGQFPGSPAQAAGIRVGDVVVSFAGHEIKTALALTVVVGAARPGEKVSVVCYRGSRRFSFTVTLGTRPAPEPGAS
jgi:S1-C subfamily serine protease